MGWIIQFIKVLCKNTYCSQGIGILYVLLLYTLYTHCTQQKMICYMRCVNAFFIDITNIFVNMTDFSCHLNQKDALRIPSECLCVILTYSFLLCIFSISLVCDISPYFTP